MSPAITLLLSMARSFKLKFRLFLSSFRLCRPKPKHPLIFPKTPSPESFHYKKQFPVNPRYCYNCYPNPPPPPPTPVGFFADPTPENSTSFCSSCKLKSYARENGLLNVKKNRAKTEHKISGKENQRSSPFSWITRKKSKIKKKSKKKGLKSKLLMAKGWSNGYEGEEDEGTDALVNSSISFSDDGSPVKRSETASCVRKVEGKMGESFVQVKRSKEPQEDFKRSMVEMILEKEIFETKGLEELLQCYLTLNSPEYHAVIVGAFNEVWEFLLDDSHLNK